MPKFIVFGATGFIGTNICAELKNKKHEIVATSFNHDNYIHGIQNLKADLTDKDRLKILIQNRAPDAIVYAAGVHGLPQCAEKKSLSDRINTLGAVNVAEVADRLMIPCIYLSNAYAFGNGNGDPNRPPIKPNDSASPESAHGKAKLQAENFYISRTKVGIILRLGMAIGRGGLQTLAFWDTLEKALFHNKTVKLRKDLIHSWVDSKLIAQAIETLATNMTFDGNRIVHLAANGGASLYDVGQKFASLAGYDKKLIQELPPSAPDDEKWSNHFNLFEKTLNTYSIESSARYELDTETGASLLETKLPNWELLLENYVERWKTFWQEDQNEGVSLSI